MEIPLPINEPAPQEKPKEQQQGPTLPVGGLILISPGTPCVLDLGPSIGTSEDPASRYLLHWGDGDDRTYDGKELLALGGVLLHTYNRTGIYTIALDVEDETGIHRNVATWPVAVFGHPVIGPTSGRAGQVQQFSASNTVAPGEGSPCFSWQVRNDSGKVVQQVGWTRANPRPTLSFTPTEAGWYTIQLTIQDSQGNLTKIDRSLRVTAG
jgi:hypothetical protein